MADPSNPEERAGWEMVFRSGIFPPRYQTLAAPNHTVVAWADTLPVGASVVDVGCGVGRHVLYLGGRGFQMAGLDLSPSGVKIAQQACVEREIDFDGRVSDITTLPWPDLTFDAALSTSTICHHRRANILKALDEVRRVLKPGGLFLVDFPHKNTLAYQQVRAQATAGEISEVEPDTFVDESPQPDLRDDAFLPHHYCDEADVRALLHSFEIIRLWADLPEPAPDGSPAPRGYWVAWGRKHH